jgi:hypothetical protein
VNLAGLQQLGNASLVLVYIRSVFTQSCCCLGGLGRVGIVVSAQQSMLGSKGVCKGFGLRSCTKKQFVQVAWESFL